ncbi:Smr/MutS family protein [Allosphingosinicella deserti]|uniref:DNA mismatch repair protein MutS n=1 Tax=Allosphingosinicella deserti TaxID=2116704 RepID=A0A2P7QJA5_9SPHN|nr:Smr/MutS family protein [Sphingomonas deserti]PSJ38055.1 DNA mismatch repair protein MutS [Sphingomonas deserti]
MRRLNPDEERLWAKVVESVRPIRAKPLPPASGLPSTAATPESARPADSKPVRGRRPPERPAQLQSPQSPPAPSHESTLDGSWDRRLSRGLAQPDYVLDLHGHNLSTAYDLLDSRLEMAIGSGARLLLLITGKPPGAERPVKRGAIRAAVGDWLAASRHSRDIAAVRNAHPRHGGTGALYIILRRRR